MAIEFFNTPVGRVAGLLSTNFPGVERILQDFPINHQILEKGIVTASPIDLQAIVSKLNMATLSLKDFCTLIDWLKTREGQASAPSIYKSLFRDQNEDMHFGVLAEYVVPRISMEGKMYYCAPHEFRYADGRWRTDCSIEQMSNIPFPPKGTLNRNTSSHVLPFNTRNIGSSGLPESSNSREANTFELDYELDSREITALTYCINDSIQPVGFDTIFGLHCYSLYPYFTILPRLIDNKH